MSEILAKYEAFIFDMNEDELSDNEIAYIDSLSDKELNKLLNQMRDDADYHNSLQMGEKLILNSIYGSFGNQYFVCSDVNIAGAITAMGQHLIKYVDKLAEEYFYNYWHIDFDLHEKLGIINEVKKIDGSWIHRESKTDWNEEVKDELVEDGIIQRKNPVCVYIDTDSIMVSFYEAFKSCNWTGDKFEFVMKICRERLEPLFEKKLNKLAKSFGVENLQKFELENISESAIFLTKKKYIKHIVWEDGRFYDRLTNITPKGVDLIKAGTPKFAREKVLEIIKYIFENYEKYYKNKNSLIKDLLKFVKNLRKEIEVCDIDDITKITSVNSYYSTKIMVDNKLIDGPGIIDDKQELKWAKGTYYMLKAAGLYNYKLYQKPELHNKYQFINIGDRVRYYDCIDDKNKVFAFRYEKFPIEIAPEVDYDEVFLKTVSKQVNFYLEALELPELNKRLSIIFSIF